jgi:hypothetical protein
MAQQTIWEPLTNEQRQREVTLAVQHELYSTNLVTFYEDDMLPFFIVSLN